MQREWHAKVVSCLVHINHIALHDGRVHGAGGYPIHIGETRFGGNDHQREKQDGEAAFPPLQAKVVFEPRLKFFAWAAFSGWVSHQITSVISVGFCLAIRLRRPEAGLYCRDSLQATANDFKTDGLLLHPDLGAAGRSEGLA